MTMVDPAFYLHSYTPAQARQAALELAARVRKLPGIDAATIATVPPLTRRCWIEHISAQQLYLNAVDPSYFPVMRLPLLQGRVFGSREHNALVISESAARKLWPNDLPLGKSCLVGQRTRTITSIVKDSGANLMHFPESVEAYTPIDNENATLATILVHATTNRARMSGALRSASTLPGIVPFVSTFQSFMNGQMDTIRNIVTVVVTLGAIASWLAVIGIFGLRAFTVAQRTREFGIRMALGALGFDILRCVLGQYALPFGIGAVLGTALAAAVAKVVRNLLFGFIPFDLLTFGAGLLLFAAVAFAASIVPARQALRIDPASALRYE
jgi:hypothetical protein